MGNAPFLGADYGAQAGVELLLVDDILTTTARGERKYYSCIGSTSWGTHGEGSSDVGGIRCVRSSGPSCSCYSRHATLDGEQIHSQNEVGTTHRAGGRVAAEATGEDGGEAGRHGRSGDWHDRGTGRICTTRPRRRGARAVIRIHVLDHPTSHAPPSSNSTSPPAVALFPRLAARTHLTHAASYIFQDE